MPHLHCLGNDAVDLDDPRCQGKATNERFLARVFSKEEVRTIRSSADPELTVWMLWAGKEAAFKSVTKDIGRPPVFRHNLFQVSYPDGSLKGEARYGNHRINLTAKVSPPHIHVVSWRARPNEPTPRVLWEEETNQRVVERFGLEQGTESAETLETHFSPREWNCIPHPTSAVTRLAARHSLAAALGVDEARLEIICRSGVPGRRVPLVLLDGEPTNSDLSLSHHRTLLAWAFTAPRGGSGTGR